MSCVFRQDLESGAFQALPWCQYIYCCCAKRPQMYKNQTQQWMQIYTNSWLFCKISLCLKYMNSNCVLKDLNALWFLNLYFLWFLFCVFILWFHLSPIIFPFLLIDPSFALQCFAFNNKFLSGTLLSLYFYYLNDYQIFLLYVPQRYIFLSLNVFFISFCVSILYQV